MSLTKWTRGENAMSCQSRAGRFRLFDTVRWIVAPHLAFKSSRFRTHPFQRGIAGEYQYPLTSIWLPLSSQAKQRLNLIIALHTAFRSNT